MVNKRGLSPDEFFKLDPEVLNMLMIYDSYIEPSGTYIDMLYHCNSMYNQTVNNPNLTAEGRKSFKVSDFDFLGVLDSDSTTKERIEKYEMKKKENNSNSISAIGEAIKKQVLGNKNNGKQ